MKTYKPISNVSYNTFPFLISRLNTLKKCELISDYMTGFHKGFNGRKDHYHIFLQPLQTIDTNTTEFRSWFQEVDPNNEKPLDVDIWGRSKLEDWFLYVRHDKRYLDAKGLGPKDEYDLPMERFQGTDALYKRCLNVSVFKYLSPIEKIIDCVNRKQTIYEAMAQCKVNFGAMAAFQKIYEQIQAEHDRKGEEKSLWKRVYYPYPQDYGLTEHVYYKHPSGELITYTEFQRRFNNVKN